MLSLRDGLYILLIPMLAGLILLGISVDFSDSDYPPIHSYQTFEVTVWGDTTRDFSSNAVRVVNLSSRETFTASTILLKNEGDMIPFKQLRQKSFSVLTIGNPVPAFEKYLNYYTYVSSQHIRLADEADLDELGFFNPIIVALNHPQENRYEIASLLEKLREKSEVVVVNFGDYEILKPLAGYPALLQAPNSQIQAQEVAAQALFGGVALNRGVPEYITTELGLRRNYETTTTRLGYTDPEYVGISSDSLMLIDQIINEGIANYAMPGCQVLIAKGGKVIYNKSFGYHTYDRKRPVRENDLYDLASITKVAATTLASMKLYDEGKLNLDSRLTDYFEDTSYDPAPSKVYDTVPYLSYQIFLDSMKRNPEGARYTNRDTIRYQDSLMLVGRYIHSPNRSKRVSPVFKASMVDLLTHTSGLQASLPITPYQRYINSELYSDTYDDNYSVPVANRFYMRHNYMDSLWNDTKRLRRDSARYLYSCVNMILMQRVIDSINNRPINEFVEEEFYNGLGMQTMCYNPRERFDPERLVPTASDRWRGQLLCGTVHDPTAALMGGISGNAGLFSNANDLAILSQMLLNGGEYGGERFLSDTTVELFTNRVRGHRGLGFDKPPRTTSYIIGESASLASYGHTGFTGTCFWVDPENDLVYIFLSNRIHPSVKNTRINEMRIRQRVHQVVYNAMGVPYRSNPVPHERRRENQGSFVMAP
ncbi:MAG: serine hydrolase [Bacteroidetes bacterium]|nr:serine hydrolase [Bacteroidota bacterium]